LEAGDIYVNTTDKKACIYDGSLWHEYALTTTSTSTSTSTSTVLLLQLNMADTHFSKLAGRIVSATTAPIDPEQYQMYYDSTRNVLKIYINTSWYGIQFS
jgi:hypothetical protein